MDVLDKPLDNPTATKVEEPGNGVVVDDSHWTRNAVGFVAVVGLLGCGYYYYGVQARTWLARRGLMGKGTKYAKVRNDDVV